MQKKSRKSKQCKAANANARSPIVNDMPEITYQRQKCVQISFRRPKVNRISRVWTIWPAKCFFFSPFRYWYWYWHVFQFYLFFILSISRFIFYFVHDMEHRMKFDGDTQSVRQSRHRTRDYSIFFFSSDIFSASIINYYADARMRLAFGTILFHFNRSPILIAQAFEFEHSTAQLLPKKIWRLYFFLFP